MHHQTKMSLKVFVMNHKDVTVWNLGLFGWTDTQELKKDSERLWVSLVLVLKWHRVDAASFRNYMACLQSAKKTLQNNSVLSLTDTFLCLSIHHTVGTHTHTQTQSGPRSLTQSLPTGVGLLCKAVWMTMKSQRTVCALDSCFTLMFPPLTGTRATEPDSCEGSGPLHQSFGFCRRGRGGSSEGQSSVSSQSLDFAFSTL